MSIKKSSPGQLDLFATKAHSRETSSMTDVREAEGPTRKLKPRKIPTTLGECRPGDQVRLEKLGVVRVNRVGVYEVDVAQPREGEGSYNLGATSWELSTTPVLEVILLQPR